MKKETENLGIMGNRAQVNYAAAKAGLLMLASYLLLRWYQEGLL